MRRYLLTICLALPLAAQAETAMQQELCREGWQTTNAAMGQAVRFLTIEPVVNDDGWCQIDRSIADLREDDFSKLVWRANGIEEAVEKGGFPESFEAHFAGINLVEAFGIPLPPERAGAMAQLYVDASRDAETRDFAVEHLDFDFGDLGTAQMSFAGGGIDLSGLKQMQFTVGGLRFHEAALTLTTTLDLSQALREGIAGASQMALLEELVAVVPDSSISDESRAALQRFVAVGPDQAGTLEVEARSETGLGVVQVAGGVMLLEQGRSTAGDLRLAVDQILTGVRIEVRWIPDS